MGSLWAYASRIGAGDCCSYWVEIMTDNAVGEKQPDARLSSLAAAVGAVKTRGPAPVHLWHPPYCGAIDMRIAADGTWFYQGTPILRPALVRLFAGLLRKDPERFVLVTPVECVGITVEDAPFAAIAMAPKGNGVAFVTNVGDEVEAGEAHPMRFATSDDGGIKPYVHVRAGLWARLSRSLAIDLVDLAVTETVDGVAMMGIRSGGTFFPMGSAEPP